MIAAVSIIMIFVILTIIFFITIFVISIIMTVESRSKPGAYFYAHPATKRTQLEHPGKTRDRETTKSKRAEGPRRKAAGEGTPEALDVEDFEDPTEKAERLRQEAEEAEAAEVARQEMARHQRAAKRALLRDAPEDKKDEESGSDEENELVSKEDLARWKEAEEQREREEAEAERRRKEEEERKRREAEEAERRRLEEEERQREEEERRREEEQKEKIALWKHRVEMARKEAEFELSMAKERQKKAEADKEVAKQLEVESLTAMSLRSSTVIEDDVREARERFVANKRLSRLDIEEDTIVFQVFGLEGDFTAFLSDPYPMESTVVYGPDDFELHTSGTIHDTILAVISKLKSQEGKRLREDSCSDAGEEELDWIVTERPPELGLQSDLDSVRNLFGDGAVDITQLCPKTYRVRLYVPVKCAILDTRVCSAWGFKPDVPICVELCLPASGYAFGVVKPYMLTQIRQEGFPEFGLEKQLMQILADFCLVCSCKSWESFESGADDVLEDDTPDKLYRRFELKKQSLTLEALGNKELGFLSCLGRYLQLRMPTLHEYCAICDSPFTLPPMMMRAVCPRELCTYQFGEFGSKITSAEGMNNHAEVVDLLVCMLLAAARSSRRHLILDPFPKVYVGEDLRVVLNPDSKDFSKLEAYVQELQGIRTRVGNQIGASWSAKTSSMSAEAAALLKWTVASNRSFLAPLQDNERIEAFRTPFQYLLISAPPDKEARFQELKKQFHTSFAFHGSSSENWHSILRNGLKNASNTKMMTCGAAHGPGIYLSTASSCSLGYTRHSPVVSEEVVALKRQKTGNRFVENQRGLVMMAVCEVVEDPSRLRKPTAHIWVAGEEELVCTRFFLVFSEAEHFNLNVSTLKLDKEIRTLAEKLRQALLERKKQEAEEEKKKAEADLRRKAEAERMKKEIEAKHQKVLPIPEPSDEIPMPCFDVFKGGNRIGRFLLKPQQKSWLLGRAPVGVDFRLGHETISRKHAQVQPDVPSPHQLVAQDGLRLLCT
ncbi:PARP6 [Symbiodinium sp. CCMP2592]|nr:PARP6 [Symbiodinium sp. CCMP2592]